MDDEGVCSGCRVHEEKDWIDWAGRWFDLVELVRPYRSSGQKTYDCIIPVTGGGDSFFIVHVVKNLLGLNPLVVSYNHQFSSSLGIRNLAKLREVFDVPLRQKTVSPRSVRKIVKATLAQFGSVHWHAVAGQTAFPVQVAVETGIPLIIWGAHQGVEQVGMYSHLDGVEMTRRYRKEHDLMGREADDLLLPYSDLTDEDVWQLRYPEDADLLRHGVRGIYLSNFMRWDPMAQNLDMTRRFGFRGARLPGTFDPFDHVDSLVYMGFHDHLKRMKCGYGKATDHSVREIRHGRLGRDRALRLIRSYDEPKQVAWVDLLAKWLGANPKGLVMAADAHRDGRFWDRLDLQTWHRHGDAITHEGSGATLDRPGSKTANFDPLGTKCDELDSADSFVLVGRGFPY
jgi:N-acetyl sugar amidotransferase